MKRDLTSIEHLYTIKALNIWTAMVGGQKAAAKFDKKFKGKFLANVGPSLEEDKLTGCVFQILNNNRELHVFDDVPSHVVVNTETGDFEVMWVTFHLDDVKLHRDPERGPAVIECKAGRFNACWYVDDKVIDPPAGFDFDVLDAVKEKLKPFATGKSFPVNHPIGLQHVEQNFH